MAAAPPYRLSAAALDLDLRVTPKAAHAAIERPRADGDGRVRLRVRVTAPADRGTANEAALRLLARAFGIARGRLSLIAGETGRSKTVRIAGPDAPVIARRIDAYIGALEE